MDDEIPDDHEGALPQEGHGAGGAAVARSTRLVVIEHGAGPLEGHIQPRESEDTVILLKLVDAFLSEPGSCSLPVRVRFSRVASFPQPSPRTAAGPDGAAWRLRLLGDECRLLR